MRKPIRSTRRDGAVLPLVTISLIGLLAFVALAVDIGLMAVARTQTQAAADVAALAGARTLDGTTGNNKVPAETEAKAAQANTILGATVTPAQVTTTTAGVYKYNTGSQRFVTDFVNAPSGLEAYGAMRVVIVADQQTYFGRFLGVNSMTVSAVATAVHRPRDIVLSLDFSGSMKYSSEFNYPSNVSTSIDISGVLNPDSRFPRFGPWKVYPVATAGTPNPMHRLEAHVDTGGETHAATNLTTATANGPPIVQNFQTNAAAAGTNAFVYNGDLTGAGFNINNTPVCTPAPDTWNSQYASGYKGDRWPLKLGNASTNPAVSDYAKTAAELLNISSPGTSTRDATFEANGYDDSRLSGFKNGALTGYVMGPGYAGKSFYMWPPDPRYTAGANPTTVHASNPIKDASNNWIADWRKRFFLTAGPNATTKGSPLDDNSQLWTSTGVWQTQNLGSTIRYIPNYDAILKWIKTGPQTLPSALRAGRVLYYTAIPDTINLNWQTGVINAGATDNERFWKEYIDFVLGSGRHSRNKTLAGYGANNTWSGNTFGTGKITAKASLTGTTKPYMAYDDCPVHPRLHTWFGPLTMMGFLSINSNNVDYNWYAGTTYEAQTWQLKAGIKAALDDIKKNHPNDLAALGHWSHHNGYNTARVDMGKDYDTMQRCLYYPFNIVKGIAPYSGGLGTASNEMRPYAQSTPSNANPSGVSTTAYAAQVPCGDGSTNPAMGLMVAYNQLNWTGTWKGRKGAAKVVIMETDGVANQTCNGTFSTISGGGGRKEWTGISNGASPGNGHPDALDHALSAAYKLCQDDTGSKPWPTFPAYANPGGAVPNAGTPTNRYTATGPGFSTSRSPAQIHTLAFGELFEPATVSPMKTRALEFLRNVQLVGGTSPAGATSIESYKIITGTADERISKIKEALERIMQGGIQVALVE